MKPDRPTLKKYRDGLPGNLIWVDVENFYRCMAAYKITGMELEMAKQAYCRTPESSQISYAAMARKLPEPSGEWVTPNLQAKKVKRA